MTLQELSSFNEKEPLFEIENTQLPQGESKRL
jgi:hypothetical protein